MSSSISHFVNGSSHTSQNPAEKPENVLEKWLVVSHLPQLSAAVSLPGASLPFLSSFFREAVMHAPIYWESLLLSIGESVMQVTVTFVVLFPFTAACTDGMRNFTCSFVAFFRLPFLKNVTLYGAEYLQFSGHNDRNISLQP